MFRSLILALSLTASAAFSCEQAVCLTDESKLRFTRLIDFDDLPNAVGIGSRLDQIIIRDGAMFGERFLGQLRHAQGDFDVVTGAPIVPLTLVDGGRGETLGAMHLLGSTALHGVGPRAYPKDEAVGEGALAVLFDRDQPALGFDILGGENGEATVHFFRRDGSLIASMTLSALARVDTHVFERQGGQPDIAGFVLLNSDPQGISIDNLRFESNDVIG